MCLSIQHVLNDYHNIPITKQLNYIVQYTAVTTIMSYQMDPIVHKYVDPQKECDFHLFHMTTVFGGL